MKRSHQDAFFVFIFYKISLFVNIERMGPYNYETKRIISNK